MKLTVKVKPNNKQPGLEFISETDCIARIKSPPVDGKANEELILLLSKHFRVPKTNISIISGLSSKSKLVTVHPRD
ncbi:DUF167 domain-containing protein [Leptospira sp. 2 VSF19]|uniref:UPF0235 protein ND861_09925 n=1 Tax=Leptospira soteropolitanensis TaxID=2950025 RepID=A0AAW5VDC5_9LEPT|nr:DUF167 domain-containing protein [Leptospira soteropolitanensis]MCW7492475.1 DUF167 domain-containing protein [Leptospira soteropolitanensis]MCW7500525.1 DUF167 domain-containing protein [Leptospira soteropolitanensis]MCW7522805.1 DUF167 domain-containing protein [Leptospira soteropolitanensis]MCW7526663.1 DUF167 domain-containing protein [Leptospira soteropolitanensis]MCW7530495.1 DUF167 domain-containing protein [Leptospira soteropolitanensis]